MTHTSALHNSNTSTVCTESSISTQKQRLTLQITELAQPIARIISSTKKSLHLTHSDEEIREQIRAQLQSLNIFENLSRIFNEHPTLISTLPIAKTEGLLKTQLYINPNSADAWQLLKQYINNTGRNISVDKNPPITLQVCDNNIQTLKLEEEDERNAVNSLLKEVTIDTNGTVFVEEKEIPKWQ